MAEEPPSDEEIAEAYAYTGDPFHTWRRTSSFGVFVILWALTGLRFLDWGFTEIWIPAGTMFGLGLVSALVRRRARNEGREKLSKRLLQIARQAVWVDRLYLAGATLVLVGTPLAAARAWVRYRELLTEFELDELRPLYLRLVGRAVCLLLVLVYFVVIGGFYRWKAFPRVRAIVARCDEPSPSTPK